MELIEIIELTLKIFFITSFLIVTISYLSYKIRNWKEPLFYTNNVNEGSIKENRKSRIKTRIYLNRLYPFERYKIINENCPRRGFIKLKRKIPAGVKFYVCNSYLHKLTNPD